MSDAIEEARALQARLQALLGTSEGSNIAHATPAAVGTEEEATFKCNADGDDDDGGAGDARALRERLTALLSPSLESSDIGDASGDYGQPLTGEQLETAASPCDDAAPPKPPAAQVGAAPPTAPTEGLSALDKLKARQQERARRRASATAAISSEPLAMSPTGSVDSTGSGASSGASSCSTASQRFSDPGAISGGGVTSSSVLSAGSSSPLSTSALDPGLPETAPFRSRLGAPREPYEH